MNSTRARNNYEVTEDAIVELSLDLRLLNFNKTTNDAIVSGSYPDMLVLRKCVSRHGITINGK